MKKLAIISTHPIQYNAPWFAMLAQQPEMELKVFYTWSQRQTEFFDDNFGKEIKWDIPLLEGYDYAFVENRSNKPGNKSFWGIQCPDLINRLNAFNPTHILVFGWNFQAHFAVMRHFKGKVPVLFRGDSTLLDYEFQTLANLLQSTKTHSFFKILPQYLKFKLRKQFLTFIYRYIDMALYVGSNNKAYFKAHGLKEYQLRFVPHAIDNNRFTDNKEKHYANKALEWRRSLQIKDTDFVILFAGKFEPRKNPEVLINAFNILSIDEKFNAKLLMIGNGPLESKLKELSKNNSNIIFLPFQNQSDMPLVYNLGNLFCLSSQSETWGLAVNEAIACGTPVVASTKVGCAIDLVTQPPCYQFQSGNIENLTDVLRMAIQNISTKTDSNWNSFISNWSFEVLINKIMEALK